jgi:thiol-disulfide isomerase/thioredoxin
MKLGPVLLPYAALVLFVVIFLSFAIARYFDRRSEMKIEPRVTQILLVAIVAARLFFVWRYRAVYLSSPISILDIRDGGWDAQAGAIAAWIYTFILTQRIPRLRKPLVLTVGAASLVWLAGSLIGFLNAPVRGTMPASVLQGLNGQEVSLTGFRGKPTVVNFWATWCPPCRREMPAMAKVQANRPGVNFVFVNQGESKETVDQFLSAGRLDLKNVLLDRSQAVARGFSVMGYPTTLFFDASGKLIYQHMGPLSEASLIHYLEESSEP